MKVIIPVVLTVLVGSVRSFSLGGASSAAAAAAASAAQNTVPGLVPGIVGHSPYIVPPAVIPGHAGGASAAAAASAAAGGSGLGGIGGSSASAAAAASAAAGGAYGVPPPYGYGFPRYTFRPPFSYFGVGGASASAAAAASAGASGIGGYPIHGVGPIYPHGSTTATSSAVAVSVSSSSGISQPPPLYYPAYHGWNPLGFWDAGDLAEIKNLTEKEACEAFIDQFSDDGPIPAADIEMHVREFVARPTNTSETEEQKKIDPSPAIFVCCHALFSNEFFPGSTKQIYDPPVLPEKVTCGDIVSDLLHGLKGQQVPVIVGTLEEKKPEVQADVVPVVMEENKMNLVEMNDMY